MQRHIFWIAPIVFMLVGEFHMPYGYYALERLVVCLCASFFAYQLYHKNDETFVWIFGFIAVLYNPLLPIHLGQKRLWLIVNIITAVLFLIKKDALCSKGKTHELEEQATNRSHEGKEKSQGL